MTQDRITAITAADLASGFEALVRKRDEHLAAARDIDMRITNIAHMIGLDKQSSIPNLLKVSAAENALVKEVDEGVPSMGAHIVSVLRNEGRGLTRLALRAEIEKVPLFKARFEKQVNGFYNAVGRYIKAGHIVDVDGVLYPAESAPAREQKQTRQIGLGLDLENNYGETS